VQPRLRLPREAIGISRNLKNVRSGLSLGSPLRRSRRIFRDTISWCIFAIMGSPRRFLTGLCHRILPAYFAFRERPDPALDACGKVSIYVYLERLLSGQSACSSAPTIHSRGSYVRSDRRHFQQQFEYTICMVRDNGEWYYASHENVFARGDDGQDLLWKFNIPSTERLKACDCSTAIT
jgi:hypothetical protein